MTFVLTDQRVAQHDKGSLLCRAGWCSNSDGTPVPYTHPDCGGIVHGDLLDQHGTPPSWEIQVGCDKCDLRRIVVQTPEQSFVHGEEPEALKVVETSTKKAGTSKRAPARKAAKKK